MKIILCVDKSMGMMFFGRRQSQDRILREWIHNHTAGYNLWMSQYSARQFQDQPDFLCDDDYSQKAGADDYCFVEDKGFDLWNVSEIILCHWNRKYQSDLKFTVDLKANGFRKVNSENIQGSSHDKITIETYRR